LCSLSLLFYYIRPSSILNFEEKVVHIAQRNQKRGVKEKSVNREKHEKDKMTEDSNTHGSEEYVGTQNK
jgi:hypothetical protein